MSAKKYHYVRKTFRYQGKRYEVTAKTETEAMEKLARLKLQLEQEPQPGQELTVSDWYWQWRALYKENSGITAKSLSSYDEEFRKYIQPSIGSSRLADVHYAHLQHVLNQAAGMSYSHLTKIRSLMQQLFFRAHQSRLIPYNPAEGLQLPAFTRNVRRSLTPGERECFLRVEPTVPGCDIYYAMLMSGMRPGELAVLQWGDIDFEKNEISVSKALESGSQNKIKGTKTTAGNRLIPMRRPLAERLRPRSGAPEAYVFTRPDGMRHTSNSLHKLWTELRAAMEADLASRGMELAGDLVPYCLRHTFCTDLQNAGVPINVAKELMGHSSISTTANVYTHRNKDTLHSNIALLDKAAKNTPIPLVKPRRTGGKSDGKIRENWWKNQQGKAETPVISIILQIAPSEKGSGSGTRGCHDGYLRSRRQRRFHRSGGDQL